MDPLEAISPIDGRYREKTRGLADYFSEGAIIKDRILVEIEYLITLSFWKIIRKLTDKEKKWLYSLAENFNLKNAREVKKIEKITNHDVKAIEYFLKEELAKTSLKDLQEMVHFGLTSEDINNLTYGLAFKNTLENLLLPKLKKLEEKIKRFALKYQKLPMLARTHGQLAVSTTMGKEIGVFVKRMKEEREILQKLKIKGKLNGSVGNFNAHYFVFPRIDWLKFSRDFVRSFGLEPEMVTTQILAYDSWLRIFDSLKRINGILLGLCQDFWFYISLDYFQQKLIKTEVGSSTLPHKLNPIYFENAEGNLGLANSLLDFYSGKLLVSRLQRDLSDSPVRRTIGEALGFCFLAYENLLEGLVRIEANQEKITEELSEHWEIVSEGIQSILRVKGYFKPYEKLKNLTRGKALKQKELTEWIENLAIDEKTKKKIKEITPFSYLGLAEEINGLSLKEV